MCTITLEYNQNSAIARRKLAALLATGLFEQKEVSYAQPSPEQVEAHRELREAVLAHSRKSMVAFLTPYCKSMYYRVRGTNVIRLKDRFPKG